MKRSYKEIENLIKKNSFKSNKELAKLLNKNISWVKVFKAFMNAKDKEKYKNTSNKMYLAVYRLWKKENNINEISITPEKENKQAKNTLPRIPYYQIQDLKKVIMRIALENKHLIEENNAFAEDNIAKACSINKLINEKNFLQQEIKDLKLDLKITKYSYYAVIVAATFLIIAGIKCLT